MSDNNKPRTWITDKRLLNPYEKKLTTSSRKGFRSVLKEIKAISPSIEKSKTTRPILNQIKTNNLLKSIRTFNSSSLKTLKQGILVSFSYTAEVVYKIVDKPYFQKGNSSINTTYGEKDKDLGEWMSDKENKETSQSPIRSYTIINFKVTSTTKTTFTPQLTEEIVLDEDLEDLLDLDMNGKAFELDQDLKVPTTDAYDKGIGRCVYDYLIGYYEGTLSLTYDKLYRLFHDKPLFDKYVRIKLWERHHDCSYNDKVKHFNKRVEDAKKRFYGMKQAEIEKLEKYNPHKLLDYPLCFTSGQEEFHPLTKVNKWLIPDELTLEFNDKSLWGVSIRKIQKFCSHFNLPMYALNQDNKCILSYNPTKSSNRKSLAFKMVCGHFYGIECSNTISRLAVLSSSKTTLFQMSEGDKQKKEGDDEEEEDEPLQIEVIDLNESEYDTDLDVLVAKMDKHSKVVINDNVLMKDKDIVSFQLDNTKYVIKNEPDNLGEQFYINKGEEWNGDHIVPITNNIFKETYPTQEHQSVLNSQVNKILNLDGVKHRTHLGKIDNEENYTFLQTIPTINNTKTHKEIITKTINDEVFEVKLPDKFDVPHSKLLRDFKIEKSNKPIKERKKKEETHILKETHYKCYDINKCYSSIIDKPLEPWMVLNFQDTFTPFNKDKDKILTGLYFVETDDTTLLHHSNIYSSAMVKFALFEGIIQDYQIKFKCYAYKTLKKDYFHPFIQEVNNQGCGDKKVIKNMLNLITGILGKTKSKKTINQLSTKMGEAVEYIRENGIHNPFLYTHKHKANTPQEKTFYFYGKTTTKSLHEHSLPIYIQILDQSNIKLYNMIRDSGAECIYRKTDCVVLKHHNLKFGLDIGDKWGEYSHETFPKLWLENSYEKREGLGKIMKYDVDLEVTKLWSKICIDDSSKYKEVYDAIQKHKGLMLLGRAGTGKSYVINQVEKIYNEDDKSVAKIAFTNKASLNIGGTTIHKFLKLNKEGKLLSSTINKIKNTFSLIIIDEISMVSSWLWRRLYLLKEMTSLPFLLVGDFRQIPPVEEMRCLDYRDHPTIMELGSYHYCELEKIHRYDNKLANITKSLEGMEHVKRSWFPRKIVKKNICYLNKTRVRINHLINNKCYVDGAVASPALEKDEFSQDIWVYEDLPMIARRNYKDEFVNNETFVVREVCEDDTDEYGYKIRLTATRPDDEGNATEHEVWCGLSKLQDNFLCAYCMTTHKSQGETIDGAITIHDWDLMDNRLKYTAITRAKAYANIFMV